MIFFRKRPVPHYRQGEVAGLPPGVFGPQYLVIQKLSWQPVRGHKQGQWVYAGCVFEIVDLGRGLQLVPRDYGGYLGEYLTKLHGDQTP